MKQMGRDMERERVIMMKVEIGIENREQMEIEGERVYGSFCGRVVRRVERGIESIWEFL